MEVLIAHAHNSFLSRMGGARNYFQHLIDGLLSQKDVKLTFLGMGESVHGAEWFVPVIKGEVGSWWKFDFALFKYLLRNKPASDVIIHTGKLDTMLPFFILCRKNKKILSADTPFFYVNTFRFPFNKIAGWLYNRYEAWAVKRIVAIATDERTKKYYLSKYPELEQKIHIVPAVVDMEMFKPAPKTAKNAIIFAGRLEPVKAVPYLIDAFRLLKERLADVSLLIVGSGSEEKRLKTLADGINGIVFAGEKSHEDMPTVLNSGNVLALTSTTEGSPLIVREALACGLPIVSRAVGDVAQDITPETGEIVNGSPKEFADALYRVLQLPAEQTQTVCVAQAKKYSKEKLTERIIKIYEAL